MTIKIHLSRVNLSVVREFSYCVMCQSAHMHPQCSNAMWNIPHCVLNKTTHTSKFLCLQSDIYEKNMAKCCKIDSINILPAYRYHVKWKKNAEFSFLSCVGARTAIGKEHAAKAIWQLTVLYEYDNVWILMQLLANIEKSNVFPVQKTTGFLFSSLCLSLRSFCARFMGIYLSIYKKIRSLSLAKIISEIIIFQRISFSLSLSKAQWRNQALYFVMAWLFGPEQFPQASK